MKYILVQTLSNPETLTIRCTHGFLSQPTPELLIQGSAKGSFFTSEFTGVQEKY